MRKDIIASLFGSSIVTPGLDPSKAQSVENTAEPKFGVHNPWAEVDAVTPRGISPRLTSMKGKKIGLFANFKRASVPIVVEVEKHLKSTIPDCETSLFESRGANVVETETINREQFISWVKGVDAVVLAVGD